MARRHGHEPGWGPSGGGCADPLVLGFQPPEPDAFLLFTSYVVGGILLQLPRRWQDQGASGHCLRTGLASPPWRQSASPPSSDGVPLSRALFSGPCPWPLAQDKLSAGLCCSPGRSKFHTPVLSASEFALAAPCMCVLSQHIQGPGKDTVAPGAEGLRHQRDTPASNSVLVKAGKCWKLWLQGSLSFPRKWFAQTRPNRHTLR